MAIETVSIHLKGIEYLSRKIPVPRWYKTRYNKLRPKLKEIMSEKDLPTLRVSHFI